MGCGTGDLVCAVAKQGVEAVGVDFVPDMIAKGEYQAKTEQLEHAHFHCSSIFDFPWEPLSFDLISANGFIEYISYDELKQFVHDAYGRLGEGGSLVIGSRNRLFNLFSLNAFTLSELEEEHTQALLREATALASSEPIESLFKSLRPASLQKANTKHPITGIEVATRFQYTPLQLMEIFMPKGFELLEIYPIHIHATPPLFKDKHPMVHVSVANLLQSYGRHHRELVPFASSFMLHFKKEV